MSSSDGDRGAGRRLTDLIKQTTNHCEYESAAQTGKEKRSKRYDNDECDGRKTGHDYNHNNRPPNSFIDICHGPCQLFTPKSSGANCARKAFDIFYPINTFISEHRRQSGFVEGSV
jgi:hypothetical protein